MKALPEQFQRRRRFHARMARGMVASGRTIELVNTKEIELFFASHAAIDFGDEFLLSLHGAVSASARNRSLLVLGVYT
jgi:hypothetical protein